MTTTIGARLRSLREEAGLSQRELARRADTVPQYLSALEAGTKDALGLDLAARLAGVLGAALGRHISLDSLAGLG